MPDAVAFALPKPTPACDDGFGEPERVRSRRGAGWGARAGVGPEGAEPRESETTIDNNWQSTDCDKQIGAKRHVIDGGLHRASSRVRERKTNSKQSVSALEIRHRALQVSALFESDPGKSRFRLVFACFFFLFVVGAAFAIDCSWYEATR